MIDRVSRVDCHQTWPQELIFGVDQRVRKISDNFLICLPQVPLNMMHFLCECCSSDSQRHAVLRSILTKPARLLSDL